MKRKTLAQIISSFVLILGCDGQTLPDEYRYHTKEYVCPRDMVLVGDPRFPDYYMCRRAIPLYRLKE